MKSQKHSLTQVENLCSKIIDIKDTAKSERIGQWLTQLCKLLVWGDRYDTDFFEYFIEIKALDRLLEIFSKTNSKDVVIAIISFFINLLSNINKGQSIHYLLSHPCLISLQNIKFFSLDNEIAEYYINFLNTISQKMDLNSLHIFFNKRYPTFPLLMQTTRFYNHPQSLVRTKTRSILLSCLRLNSPRIKQFAVGFPFVIYYIHECNLLKQYWMIIDSIVQQEGDKQFELQNLEGLLEDQKELVMIFDDYMKIDPKNIPKCFINAFANECMAPLLQALYTPKKVTFNLKVVLLIAYILVSNVQNQQFIDFLIFCFFGKYYTTTLCVKLMHPVQKPLSYSKKWKFKGFWDSYQSNINQYCAEVYFPNEKSIVSDIYVENDTKKQQKSQRKYTKQMRSIFGMGTNFYQREVQKIQQIFAIPINSDPQTFQRKSVSELLNEFKKKIQEGNIDLNHLEENPVRQPLLSFLKTKDDTLVMLILNLLTNVVYNKYVSPQILQFAALSTNPKNNDFKSMFDIEQIMKCCYGIMEVDPPTFRICTYKEAAILVQKLSQIYNDQVKIPQDLIHIAKLALKRSIQRLNAYIYSGKQWQKSLDTFNKVSIENEKYRRKDLYTFGFLEKELAQINTLPNYQVYNIQPKFKEQIEARDFWLYVIVRDSYCKLMKMPLKYQIANCDEKSEKNASSFEVGTSYTIQKDHEVAASYKEVGDKVYNQCSLIFLNGYFIVGVKNIVKFKSSYQDCLMVMDRSDPSKIMVQINKKVLSIQVQNAKKAYQLRKYFQQMKTLMFKYQLSLLVKQTQWMLEQAKSMNYK